MSIRRHFFNWARERYPELFPEASTASSSMPSPGANHYYGRPFEGRVIAITGGRNGIGLKLVMYLAYRGAVVEIFDIDSADWEDKLAMIQDTRPRSCCQGRQPITIRLTEGDVRCGEQVRAWMEYLRNRYHHIDGLANCAGVYDVAKLHRTTYESWDSVLSTNLLGTFNCVKEATEDDTLRNGGSIVNLTNMTAQQGHVGLTAYSSAAHGVVGFTRCAALELADKDIRVNAVCSGLIRGLTLQDMKDDLNYAALGWGTRWDEQHAPILLRRYGKTAEVARLIAFLLGDESKYITSAVVPCDGGWMKKNVKLYPTNPNALSVDI